MKPGNTYLPVASTTIAPDGASRFVPMRVICSPSQKMSAAYDSLAVMTRPFLMRSDMGDLPFLIVVVSAHGCYSWSEPEIKPAWLHCKTPHQYPRSQEH